MATNTAAQLVFRIPNLPSGPIVDAQGNATAAELNFRQALLSLLQSFVGNEGLVMPTQDAANITTIQDNSNVTPGTDITVYSCQYGTMLYNSTANSVMVAINNGSGAPIFKTVTLT